MSAKPGKSTMSKETIVDGYSPHESASEYYKEFIGQKIAVVCARFSYWGVLAKVYNDAIVIANAVSVEDSGPATSERPRGTDPINRPILINSDAIELFFQPVWSESALPSENDTESGKQRGRQAVANR